jgi:GNAT superfamily N-acetyltransferase
MIEIDFFRNEDYETLALLTKRSFALSAYTVDRHLPRALYGEVFFQTVATRALRENSNACLVARRKGVPLGYIIYGVDIELSKKFGYTLATIILFCVDEASHGQGVGRRLLLRAIDLLKSRGVDLLTVGTDANNLPALTLYQRAGFVTRLTWGAWRLYPDFPSLPVRSPFRVAQWSGEEQALQLCRHVDRPISYFRDSNIPLRGLVHLRKELASKVQQHLRQRQSSAYTAYGDGFWGERAVGLLVWEEDGSIEKFFNSEALEKRVYRISDIFIPRTLRGQGIATQLVKTFCSAALHRSHFIETWIAQDDWAMANVLVKNAFRPAHFATVLHLWLNGNPAG